MLIMANYKRQHWRWLCSSAVVGYRMHRKCMKFQWLYTNLSFGNVFNRGIYGWGDTGILLEMTQRWSFYYLQTCFHIEEGTVLCFSVVWLGTSFPTFRKNLSFSSAELSVWKFTSKPEDEGGTLLQNFEKKLLKHKKHQHTRTGFSTVTPWKAQEAVFVLLKICLFMFTLYLLCTTVFMPG
jgi:hypothetical protein